MTQRLNKNPHFHMASLYHSLSSLFLLINLLSITTPTTCKKPSSSLACPSFDCGNGQIIGYPFWQQGNQTENCGYPGFAVSCNHRQQPLFRLSDHLYSLKKIKYSENILTAAYRHLNGESNCPTAPYEIKLNSSSFLNYTMKDQMVKFFYNCTLYPPSLPDIECLRYGSKRSYVFTEGKIPEFDWDRYCDSTARVAVVGKAGDGHDSLLDKDFGGVLREGFELTWRSPESGCRLCEASGGFCGYRNDHKEKAFFCFCDGGRSYDVCGDKGDVTSAFEPDFIAIGALLCGALIAASTIFYIIQKKKISVHKPAFSRIPTGGK